MESSESKHPLNRCLDSVDFGSQFAFAYVDTRCAIKTCNFYLYAVENFGK